MKITSDITNEVHNYSRSMDLEDAPIMDVPENHWSHKGKSFQPRRVVAKWDHGSTPANVTLYGLILKKDGTVGAATFDLTYSLTGAFSYPAKAIAPVWLKDIFLEVD